VTIFGAFLAIALSGGIILISMDRPILVAVGIGFAFVMSAVVGLTFGTLVYLVRRFSEPQGDRFLD